MLVNRKVLIPKNLKSYFCIFQFVFAIWFFLSENLYLKETFENCLYMSGKPKPSIGGVCEEEDHSSGLTSAFRVHLEM